MSTRLATRKLGAVYHGRRRHCARLLEWVTAVINDLDDTGQIPDLSENITLICQTYYGGRLGAYADPGTDPATADARQKELRSLSLSPFARSNIGHRKHAFERSTCFRACFLLEKLARKPRSKNSRERVRRAATERRASRPSQPAIK